MSAIRSIIANNASPMTLDGTRTYIIGWQRVAIIDPGPDLPEHLNAVADAVGSGATVSVVVTHDHPDHSEAADRLADRLGTSVKALTDDAVIETDAGALRAIATPGHTADHFAFQLAEEGAVFCGDLMMGGLDTALVAAPEGDLAAYLASLEKLRGLGPRVIYPAHGDPFRDPAAAIATYIEHRHARLNQVIGALRTKPQSARQLTDAIYGAGLDARLRVYATSAIEAYLAYLKVTRKVSVSPAGVWSLN